MLPGDFQLQKYPRKKLALFGVLSIVGVFILGGTVLALVFVISSWLGRPVVFGFNDGPTQPIAFPHTVHVQDLELDCTFCHRTSPWAPRPPSPPSDCA